MERNMNLIGVGLDLSPHYSIVLTKYRSANPGTKLGDPGRFQGFNTGVVLYDLKRMRSNKLFNEYVDNHLNILDNLANKYQFSSHLGDQCMLTLLGLEIPEWFHVLPCDLNYQLDVSLATQKQFSPVFNQYHNCTLVPKILHGNGNTPIPEDDSIFFSQFKQ